MEKVKGIFSFSPHSESEYFRLGRLKVGRRLVLLVILLLGMFSLLYIVISGASWSREPGNIRTYKYNSFLLPYISGQVKIKALEGYVAYEGDVEGGVVSGFGLLYNDRGQTIYEGEFRENEFCGEGKLYDDEGFLKYKGEFKHNRFEGQGELYNERGERIFTGNFAEGNILYASFLGKTTGEINEMYSGGRELYYNDKIFAVRMNNLSVCYTADSPENNLEGKTVVEKVFVVGGTYGDEREESVKTEEIQEILGEPVYEGSLRIDEAEAVALGYTQNFELQEILNDVYEIRAFDKNAFLYIYDFRHNNLDYTFYFREKNTGFLMYSIAEIKEGSYEEDK